MGSFGFDKGLIVSCVDGLGRFLQDDDGRDVFRKDADTLDCLKDIDRFLRRDFTDDRKAFTVLGKCGVVTQSLLPLVIQYPTDSELVYHCLKVAVLMTMPLQAGKGTQEHLEMLQSMKAAFIDRTALAVIVSLCHGPLSKHPNMSEDDRKVLQLFLTLIRNLLWIPDVTQRDLASAKFHHKTLQADFLEAAFQENIMELVVLIAQHIASGGLRKDAPMMLEILHGIYNTLDPAAVQSNNVDALKPIRVHPGQRGRVNAPRVEGGGNAKNLKLSHGLAHLPSAGKDPINKFNNTKAHQLMRGRHSDFSGKYVRTQPDAPGQMEVLKNIAGEKASKATTIKGTEVSVQADPMMLARVKLFTERLLDGAFDALMTSIRDDARAGLHIATLSPETFLYFLRISAWFAKYVRLQSEAMISQRSKSRSKATESEPEKEEKDSAYRKVNSILCWDMINIVLRVWLMMVDTGGKQKKAIDWDLQEVSIKALREIVNVLDLAFHYGSTEDKEAADRLQQKLLHDDTKESGVLNRISFSMREFKKHDKKIAKQDRRESRQYAVDMVKTMHVVLRVYERLCQSQFRVKDRRRYKKRANKRKGKKSKSTTDAEGDDDFGGDKDDAVSEAGEEKMDENGDPIPPEDHSDSSDDDAPEPTSIELTLEFASVLKAVGHHEIVKLYMFLLEQYSRLDAPTLHAIAMYFHRVCADLRMEPVFYKLGYMRQMHTMLTDKRVRKSPIHKEILVFANRITKKLMSVLLPEDPVLMEEPKEPEPEPEAPVYITNADGTVVRQGAILTNVYDIVDEFGNWRDVDDPAPPHVEESDNEPDPVTKEPAEGLPPIADCLSGLTPSAQVDTLKAVNGRVSDLMFVELLFDKGPREIAMINEQYNWREVCAVKPTNDDGDDSGDDAAPGHGYGVHNAQRDDRPRDQLGDDDDIDALGVVHAAPKPSKAVRDLKLTSEEKLLLQELFEQVNGRRTCKDLLLDDWNEKSEKKLDMKLLTVVLASLGLKPKQLTSEQETKLRLLAEEYGGRGKRAYKVMAGILPGGFSVPAIKKLMQEHEIELSTAPATNELDDSDEDNAASPRQRSKGRKQLDDDSDDEQQHEDSEEDEYDVPPPSTAKKASKSGKKGSKKKAPTKPSKQTQPSEDVVLTELSELIPLDAVLKATDDLVNALNDNTDADTEIAHVTPSDVFCIISDLLNSCEEQSSDDSAAGHQEEISLCIGDPAGGAIVATLEGKALFELLGFTLVDSECDLALNWTADIFCASLFDQVDALQAILTAAEDHLASSVPITLTPSDSKRSKPSRSTGCPPTPKTKARHPEPTTSDNDLEDQEVLADNTRQPSPQASEQSDETPAPSTRVRRQPIDSDSDDNQHMNPAPVTTNNTASTRRLLDDTDDDEFDAAPPPPEPSAIAAPEHDIDGVHGHLQEDEDHMVHDGNDSLPHDAIIEHNETSQCGMGHVDDENVPAIASNAGTDCHGSNFVDPADAMQSADPTESLDDLDYDIGSLVPNQHTSLDDYEMTASAVPPVDVQHSLDLHLTESGPAPVPSQEPATSDTDHNLLNAPVLGDTSVQDDEIPMPLTDSVPDEVNAIPKASPAVKRKRKKLVLKSLDHDDDNVLPVLPTIAEEAECDAHNTNAACGLSDTGVALDLNLLSQAPAHIPEVQETKVTEPGLPIAKSAQLDRPASSEQISPAQKRPRRQKASKHHKYADSADLVSPVSSKGKTNRKSRRTPLASPSSATRPVQPPTTPETPVTVPSRDPTLAWSSQRSRSATTRKRRLVPSLDTENTAHQISSLRSSTPVPQGSISPCIRKRSRSGTSEASHDAPAVQCELRPEHEPVRSGELFALQNAASGDQTPTRSRASVDGCGSVDSAAPALKRVCQVLSGSSADKSASRGSVGTPGSSVVGSRQRPRTKAQKLAAKRLAADDLCASQSSKRTGLCSSSDVSNTVDPVLSKSDVCHTGMSPVSEAPGGTGLQLGSSEGAKISEGAGKRPRTKAEKLAARQLQAAAQD